jgi:lactate racemase
LRTGAWYGDNLVELEIPENWNVTVLWPKTPSPLTENQIDEALDKPVGQESIKSLCKEKKRPLIIVDDLNRPTPTEAIIKRLLTYFQNAGILLENVSILMATGTHGKPVAGAIAKKVGVKAGSSCRLLVHDCFKGNLKIGKTSFGTPVYVNRTVYESDFVVGVGGIYPNYTAGFGGGTKLALGVLGVQSIFDLHHRHRSVGWGSLGVESDFRKDLNEIARMIGLNTAISLQVNADREIVRIDCGDTEIYYPEALSFCNQAFGTPFFPDADVVISNAYPNDLSLTFARMKGFFPLMNCCSTASRVAIASCSEGVGLHNLFPFFRAPRFHRVKQLVRLIRAHGFLGVSVRAIRYLRAKTLAFSDAGSSGKGNASKNPVLLYRPGKNLVDLSVDTLGIVQKSDWSEVLRAIQEEQGIQKQLKVVVYPCAFLQFPNKE